MHLRLLQSPKHAMDRRKTPSIDPELLTSNWIKIISNNQNPSDKYTPIVRSKAPLSKLQTNPDSCPDDQRGKDQH